MILLVYVMIGFHQCDPYHQSSLSYLTDVSGKALSENSFVSG